MAEISHFPEIQNPGIQAISDLTEHCREIFVSNQGGSPVHAPDCLVQNNRDFWAHSLNIRLARRV